MNVKIIARETYVTGNYVDYSMISQITSYFCQPRQFIYQMVSLFLLSPTEFCVSPSHIHKAGIFFVFHSSLLL